MAKKNKPTIASVLRDAIRTHPEPTFTTKQMMDAVREILPDVNLQSISVALTRDFKKQKIVKKVGRQGRSGLYAMFEADVETETTKTAVAEPEPATDRDVNLTSVETGEAIVSYIKSILTERAAMEIKLHDLQIKMKNSDSEWRSTLKQKDDSIARLNQRLSAMNSRGTGSFKLPLDEVSRFKIDKAKRFK